MKKKIIERVANKWNKYTQKTFSIMLNLFDVKSKTKSKNFQNSRPIFKPKN